MKRNEFIKSLAGLGVALIIPLNSFRQKKKSYLLKCNVRGFHYYRGSQLIENMKPGMHLSLVREAPNKYDRNAIALYYRNEYLVRRAKSKVGC